MDNEDYRQGRGGAEAAARAGAVALIAALSWASEQNIASNWEGRKVDAGGDLAQAGEDAVSGRDHAHVGGVRFDHDGGQVIRDAIDSGAHGVEAVEGDDERFRGEAGRNASAIRQVEGGDAGARFRQQPVTMAVVAARELDDLVAPGLAARQAHGGHRRLRTRVDEADALDRGDRGDYTLGQGGQAGPIPKSVSRPRKSGNCHVGSWAGV